MKITWGIWVVLCLLSSGRAENIEQVREIGREKYELKHYDLAIENLEQIPEGERTELDRSYIAWSHYFLYAPEEAIEGFRENLKTHPDSVDDLCGAGWALHDMGHLTLATQLFCNALRISPAYEPAVDGYNASTGKSIRAHRGYGSISYAATLLKYSGETPRRHGHVHDLQLSYGLTGLGYLNLNITRSDIDTEADFEPYRQTEVRPGFGVYTDHALWRGTAGYLSYDDIAGGQGDAWLVGIGVESLKQRVNLFIDAYGYGSDLAHAVQVVPGLAYTIGSCALRSSLEAGHYDLNLSDDEYGAYFQQSAYWPVTRRQSLFAGVGGGESYYGLRGPGSVFYSLPDKRLADAWLQWQIIVDSWQLSLGGSYARFEDSFANQYDSFGATFSLTWIHDGLPD